MIYKTLHRKLRINPHEQPLKTGDEHRSSGRVGPKTVRFRPIPEINSLCTSISVTHVSKSVQPSFSLQGVSIYFWGPNLHIYGNERRLFILYYTQSEVEMPFIVNRKTTFCVIFVLLVYIY